MIPKSITRLHVEQALVDIAKHGIPKKREPTGYYLVHDGRVFPPKYALSIAAKFATGEELAASVFSGGEEANGYLEQLGFEIRKQRIDWTWDECYLAVWGYDQLDQLRDIVKVALYRELAELTGRSEKSVEFKIQNVSFCDPRPQTAKPISVAPNAQKSLQGVFDWYWADKDRARAMLAEVKAKFEFSLAEDHDRSQAPQREIMIEEGGDAPPSSRRKRSKKLLDKGREFFRRQASDGKLRCSACQLTKPTTIEIEIIQLHHTDPIYESAEGGRKVSIEDAIAKLLPLCPTCHALAHTSKPPLSLEAIFELRQSM